jgi:hypothetical protein
MSLKVTVIPTVDKIDVWHPLLSMTSETPPSLVKEALTGDLVLRGSKSCLPIPDGASRALPFYGLFNVSQSVSIGVSVTKNADDSVHVEDYVDDYGTNLLPEAGRTIIDGWTAAGLCAEIAVSGVSEYMDPLVGAMLWFGASFARHHRGFVGVTEAHFLRLSVGIYRPDEIERYVRNMWGSS